VLCCLRFYSVIHKTSYDALTIILNEGLPKLQNTNYIKLYISDAKASLFNFVISFVIFNLVAATVDSLQYFIVIKDISLIVLGQTLT